MHRNYGPQTVNLYKYISSVGVQSRDAFIYIYIYIYSINLQCVGAAPRCIYLSPKSPADDQIDRNKITKGLRTTGRMDRHIILPLRGFEPGRMHCAQLLSAQINFSFWFKSAFSNKNSDIIYVRIYICLFYASLFKNHLKIITSVHLNSTGRTNDRQKVTRTKCQTDGRKYKLEWTHRGPLVSCLGDNIYIFHAYFFN